LWYIKMTEEQKYLPF